MRYSTLDFFLKRVEIKNQMTAAIEEMLAVRGLLQPRKHCVGVRSGQEGGRGASGSRVSLRSVAVHWVPFLPCSVGDKVGGGARYRPGPTKRQLVVWERREKF